MSLDDIFLAAQDGTFCSTNIMVAMSSQFTRGKQAEFLQASAIVLVVRDRGLIEGTGAGHPHFPAAHLRPCILGLRPTFRGLFSSPEHKYPATTPPPRGWISTQLVLTPAVHRRTSR